MVRYLIYLTFISLSCASVKSQKYPYDGYENELTITVTPGGIECFFQKAKTGSTLELEYQVIDSSFGDVEIQQELHINFQLLSPTERELISDFKQSDATHRHDVKEEGDYKFCFDNRYSSFFKKTVYFEVYVDSEDYDEKWDDIDFMPELLYNDTMDQLKISIAKLKEDLNKIKHHQDQLKAIESRDRNIQEHNFTRINQFSIFIIVVMVVVGAIQVVMVRSLFEEHSKLHKVFKMLS
ncbi:transmembrane emp24 domain-containing protein 5-like [Uloborus diversus]|uniref:transmembrane emp24 domain-containing protein 5-like n=1 Tax=Uloborus diversus TaxID=327109 RepID=UPI0024095652|nr:transmembrane emp24 domain-containing protein 5-like [Uloborus diversus]